MSADHDLKRREEEKRERAYDPVQRWIHIQQTIAWAEANMPPEQRRNRPRTRAGKLDPANRPVNGEDSTEARSGGGQS